MNLDTIKANAKRDRQPVEAWGGTLYVRTLTAADLDAVFSADGDAATRREIVARGLTNDAGERVFDSDDGRAFLDGPDADGETVLRAYKEVCTYNRLGVEDAAKN
jgi:hypothetical protein